MRQFSAYSLRLFLVCALFISLFPFVSAEVPADYALPQIVEKPLQLTPGQPVLVELYNGGHGLWSDLEVRIVDSSGLFVAVLEPESFGSVYVDVPFAYLFEAPFATVELWYDGELIDVRFLPVVTDFPKQLAFVDPFGPEVVILLDSDQFSHDIQGVQVELAILDGDDIVFLDFYGPFYFGVGEQLVYRVPLDEAYVSPGTFVVRGTFYEQDLFFEETFSAFSYGSYGSPWKLVLLVVGAILFVLLLYVFIDMAFYRRSFVDSWFKLR